MTEISEWRTVCSPGYLGKYRDQTFAQWDLDYGIGNWRLVWKLGEISTDFLGACALYEDAYFEFLRSSAAIPSSSYPNGIVWSLVNEASDVYDDEISNVHSGFDYMKQETARTHIQDIAIRRCVLRMGLRFKGNKLIRIRQEKGDHPLSFTLSPGNVPFHMGHLIKSFVREKQW